MQYFDKISGQCKDQLSHLVDLSVSSSSLLPTSLTTHTTTTSSTTRTTHTTT
jgi:hypothetical protein